MTRTKIRIKNKTQTPNEDQANLFQYYWRILVSLPELKRLEIRNKENGGELKFAKDYNGRRWRFDWALPRVRVAVEVDGGRVMCKQTHKGNWVAVGHHNTDDDLDKSNTALELGWAVFHFSPKQLNSDPNYCIGQVAKVVLDRLHNRQY